MAPPEGVRQTRHHLTQESARCAPRRPWWYGVSLSDGLLVVAEDDLGHARRLGCALALEREPHRHLGAAGDVLDLEELGAEAQLGTDRHGGGEPDLAGAVVHA